MEYDWKMLMVKTIAKKERIENQQVDDDGQQAFGTFEGDGRIPLGIDEPFDYDDGVHDDSIASFGMDFTDSSDDEITCSQTNGFPHETTRMISSSHSISTNFIDDRSEVSIDSFQEDNFWSISDNYSTDETTMKQTKRKRECKKPVKSTKKKKVAKKKPKGQSNRRNDVISFVVFLDPLIVCCNFYYLLIV